MRRRELFVAALAPGLLAQTPQDLEAEFSGLFNEFVADWNLLVSAKIRGRWDVKVARDVEKDFQKLTEHPGWITARRK